MTIGNQLMRKFGTSSSNRRKQEEFQADLKRFHENHREKDYQAAQRRMEALLQK